MKRVLYGAIDIGTNAGRLMIGYVIKNEGFTRVRQVQIVRVPLRLGDDVFGSGKISKEKEQMFINTLKSFRLLMKAYGVRSYKAYATSAMREASNRDEILANLKIKAGINLETIAGEKEANLIFSTFYTQKLPDYQYLFIDVGGGSTELSFIFNGEKRGSRSFKIGTVRTLKGKNNENSWKEIEEWMNESKIIEDDFAAIGTGGNINRVAKLYEKRYLDPISTNEISKTLKHLESFTYEERIQKLRFKPDRADVIIPALNIYKRIMEIGNINQIFVPKMGLADGMILEQYHDNIDNDIFF